MVTKVNYEAFDDLIDVVREYVPKFKVISKQESWLHKIIGYVFPVYSTGFWTTIGYTAARPDDRDGSWELIPHEGLHSIQAIRRTRILFGFLYLFPQSLSLVFLTLSVVFSWWWLLGLVCLLPLPAPFRAKFELEAYCVSVMIQQWVYGSRVKETIDHIVDNLFSGPSYYCMWPFKKMIREKLWDAVYLAQKWESLPYSKRDPYISRVYSTLKIHGYIRAI